MNYSDYDSEDYSSNEDEDYVPSDDNLSEDDLNECVKEDGLDAEDQGEAPSEQLKKKKKKPSKGLSARKRKKGGLKLEEGDEGDGDKKKDEELKLPDETSVAESTVNKEVQQMKKADDLWATFLSDVGQRPKAETAGLQQITADSGEVRKPSAESPHKEAKATEASRITITKVYDFAGEAVRVTKEVDANSLEAKNFLKKEAKEDEQQISSSKASAASSLTAGPSVKRPAGMSSVLGRIGTKKAKMSTLEKSKLDWDTFKTEEGITDELAIHNRGKEGYVERKNFLERVDQRRFELEKNIRLSNMKR